MLKKGKDVKLNLLFSLLEGFYWADFCVAVSYGVVYLQARGYSNSRLGIIMAIGALVGFLAGPLSGTLIDKYEKITVFNVVPLFLMLQLISAAAVLVCPGKCAALSVAWALFAAFSQSSNSVYTKLSVDAEHLGRGINYSVGRGIGSLCFVLCSVLLGVVVENYGVEVLPCFALVLSLAQLAVLPLTKKEMGASGNRTSAVRPEREESSGIVQFARENGHFFLLMAGVTLIYSGHNTVGNFIVNVTGNLGGSTETMGFVSGFTAAMEIPPMLFYKPLSRRFGCMKLMRFSIFMFAVKGIAVALAGSITALYFAFVLQAFSFAIFTPASVEYAEKVIAYRDSAKAQTYLFGSIMLGSLFASMIGGLLYDKLGVASTLAVCAVCTAVGVIIAEAGIAAAKRKGEIKA